MQLCFSMVSWKLTSLVLLIGTDLWYQVGIFGTRAQNPSHIFSFCQVSTSKLQFLSCSRVFRCFVCWLPFYELILGLDCLLYKSICLLNRQFNFLQCCHGLEIRTNHHLFCPRCVCVCVLLYSVLIQSHNILY